MYHDHVDWVHNMTTWVRVYHSYKIEMGALRICFSITDVDVNWWRHVASQLCFHVNITYSAHIDKNKSAFTSPIELIDLMDPPDDHETKKTCKIYRKPRFRQIGDFPSFFRAKFEPFFFTTAYSRGLIFGGL